MDVFIRNRRVGGHEPPYVIAEIGSNHNQDLNLALQMIDMAAEAGADAAKFQSLKFSELYREDYETQEFRDWFKSIELNEEWYQELSRRAASNGIDFISAPTYIRAVDLLEACDVPAYKLASPQVQGNPDVVRAAAMTGKPIIMSTGYCTYGEIAQVLEICRQAGNESLVLLHCVSSYPLSPGDGNLRMMNTLKSMSGAEVGFSDHSHDDHLAIAATAMGACVLEKHVTIDRGMKGPDHHFAMTFDEFGKMVKRVAETHMALGDGVHIAMTPKQQKLRDAVQLKLFSGKKLFQGQHISSQDVCLYRCNQDGIEVGHLSQLQQFNLVRDVEAGEKLCWDMFSVVKTSRE